MQAADEAASVTAAIFSPVLKGAPFEYGLGGLRNRLSLLTHDLIEAFEGYPSFLQALETFSPWEK